MTIKGSCHCGNTTFEVDAAPADVTRCTCSFCSKRGGLWAYYKPAQFRLTSPPDNVGAGCPRRTYPSPTSTSVLRYRWIEVIGSKNSSNSQRLVEVARRTGARDARLIDAAADLDPAWLDDVRVVGLTAGASAPEVLVEEVIDRLTARFEVTLEEIAPTRETVSFKLPRTLTDA